MLRDRAGTYHLCRARPAQLELLGARCSVSWGLLSNRSWVAGWPRGLGQDTLLSLFPLLPFACLSYLDCQLCVTESACS